MQFASARLRVPCGPRGSASILSHDPRFQVSPEMAERPRFPGFLNLVQLADSNESGSWKL